MIFKSYFNHKIKAPCIYVFRSLCRIAHPVHGTLRTSWTAVAAAVHRFSATVYRVASFSSNIWIADSKMGNADTKLDFRKAVIQLTTKTMPVDASDDPFWDQFWSESVNSVQDVFALVPSTEIRALREESPSNLATLCYKAVEKLVLAADSSCRTKQEHIQVLNSVRLLVRLIPYIFEDPEWKGFFWSNFPQADKSDAGMWSQPQ